MPGYGACAHVQKRLLRERVPEPGINRSLTAQHLGNCDCKDCAFRLKLAWGANLKLVAARCSYKHIHPPITDYIPPSGSKLAIVQTIYTRLLDSYWLVLFNYFSTFQINNAPEKVKLHKILFHFIVSLVPQILSSVSYNGRAGQCLFVSNVLFYLVIRYFQWKPQAWWSVFIVLPEQQTEQTFTWLNFAISLAGV